MIHEELGSYTLHTNFFLYALSFLNFYLENLIHTKTVVLSFQEKPFCCCKKNVLDHFEILLLVSTEGPEAPKITVSLETHIYIMLHYLRV